jgi:hypothetical protein
MMRPTINEESDCLRKKNLRRRCTHEQLFLVQNKASMTSIEIRLLRKDKLSIFCRTHEQIKSIKEKLPEVKIIQCVVSLENKNRNLTTDEKY